jgi:SAM-dependent methyltransferase
MKKLTELVRIREHLQLEYNLNPIVKLVNELKSKIFAIGQSTDLPETAESVLSLDKDLEQLYAGLDSCQDRFDLAIGKINRDIQQESQKFYTDNYNLEIQVEAEAIDIIRKVRVMSLSESLKQTIINRLQFHSTWKYPALEIGCRDGEWTQYLVASDPLYITDQYRDFLISAVENFTPEYQQRVRSYHVRDANFDSLPTGQFGFIFCWNFLNYRSLDTVKEYLKSVKELLRPGGIFMFSYNNGDIHEQAGYAEGFWMSYLPKSMLIPMCESIGLEVVYSNDVRGEGTAISWIEVKKPGTLETVKAHQVLGEIKRIGR